MTTFSFANPESFQFQSRTIGIITFPGVEALDITGPFEVFNFANLGLKRHGIDSEPIYTIKLLGEKSGPIKTLSGMQVIADDVYGDPTAEYDTLLIPGGHVEEELKNRALLDWIKMMAPRVKRVASVCTGAFLLAEADLLNGCAATTHWHYCQELAQKYPEVKVEADRIFIKSGHIFTSGGITAGIDLALALLEEDWGRDLALFVARFLVVFLKRPGGQSQFSTYLSSEAFHRNDLRELQSWIIANLHHDLKIDSMAERLSMSPRNFARVFLTETGMTPAKFVETARVDQARHFLETTELSIETVADKTGFKDPERMRRTFIRHLGVNPQNYRQRFSKAASMH
jgi:transcriptional regulator GlxA family with amidase domain